MLRMLRHSASGCGRQAAVPARGCCSGQPAAAAHVCKPASRGAAVTPLSNAINLQVGEGKAAYEAAVNAVKSWEHLQLGENEA